MRGETRRLFNNLWPVACSLCPFILAIPAIQPLLRNQLTAGYDNVLHLWRAIETDALLSAGILYSRWQPHMAFGFGYPLLLFQSPLSPLLASLLHRLGLEWLAAVNGVFVIGAAFSGWTMWLLMRDLWGEEAGIVAAAVILTIPFHAYVNFRRASMSEALAWAFPGLILWGLLRWQKHGQRRGLLAAAGGQAAMLLTHDVSSYLFLPFAVALVAAMALAHRSFHVLGRGLLALALGIGLTAFFWLPSAVERSQVQFDQALRYWQRQSFVPLDYLLEPPRAVDSSLINPWLPKGIGLLPALAALPALGACLKAETRERGFWLAAALVSTAGCLWLASPSSQFAWRLIPWLQYLQFPWRFLTPAAFGVAILAGAGIGWLHRRIRLAAPVVVGVLILGALGWLYPFHSYLPTPATLHDMLIYEAVNGYLGGTMLNELLPVWVDELPDWHTLEKDLKAGREPTRLRPETLPEGATVLEADYGPLKANIVLETPVPFRARYMAFYYPGWRVWVDGEPVPVTPTEPDGLIAFDVPAGRHAIRVRFGETPTRLIADVLSLISLTALLALIIRPPRILSRITQHVSRTRPPNWLLLLTALLVLIAKLAVIDRFDTPLRHANLVDGRLRRVDIPTEITFGDEFVLLGYDTLPEDVSSDRRFDVQTYWRALKPGGSDYGVTVNVVDTQSEDGGYRWNSTDIRPPRWHYAPSPVGQWPPDQYAIVALSIPLLPGTPPGTYTVKVVAFDRATLAPLTAHDADGLALGPALPLGQIAVTAPRRPADPDELDIRHRLDTSLGPLTLLGADFDRDEAAPGDPILVTTFWYAEVQPLENENLTVHLTLLAADGSPAAEYDFPPTIAWHPTSAWQPGDVWRGQHILHFPASLESGDYSWQLSLEPIHQSTALPSTIHITAPPRTFTPPPFQHPVGVTLGDVATLVGFDLTPPLVGEGTEEGGFNPGEPLAVTLVWRAEAETRTSYRVFLHLIGPDGALVVQSDGIPANWTRPTTGWLPGEYVTDEHVLTLPAKAQAGDYTLSAGLYVPDGERLTAPDGSGRILLTTITVEGQ